MREILFRGKRIDNVEWVEGYLIQKGGETFIACYPYFTGKVHETSWLEFCFGGFITVDPETVSQFTGLTDKNGKKIFEGDIVKYESGATVLFHKVVFERRNGCAYFGAVMGEYETWGFCNSFPPTLVEIVGNIHDNPELLEVSE